MKNNNKSNKCINLFLLISTIIFQYIMPMEYNKECNNSQDLQQNNNEYSNDNKFSILMDLIPELQFYMMSKLVETEAYNKQYDVNNHIVIKGILCNLFSTCKYFKQFNNERDINYIIVNICDLLKSKSDENCTSNTNELKAILNKGFGKLKEMSDEDFNILSNLDFLEIKKLVLHGVDVNAKDKNGCTALMWVASRGHVNIVKLLIDLGADVNLQDNNDNTALMVAAKNGYADIVKLLISVGADINLKDSNGQTALMLALHDNHKEIVKLLITSGAIE